MAFVGSTPDTVLQVLPALVVLNMPPKRLPANTVPGLSGSMARYRTGKVICGLLQLAPPSVVLHTPMYFPTYTVPWFSGSITKAEMKRMEFGTLSIFQLSPPSVLLEIPPDVTA